MCVYTRLLSEKKKNGEMVEIKQRPFNFKYFRCQNTNVIPYFLSLTVTFSLSTVLLLFELRVLLEINLCVDVLCLLKLDKCWKKKYIIKWIERPSIFKVFRVVCVGLAGYKKRAKRKTRLSSPRIKGLYIPRVDSHLKCQRNLID